MAGQIAISVMLLIGAGWFLRTLRNLENVHLGYPRESLVLMEVDLLAAGYSGERLPIAFEDLRDRLARIPGVRAVTYSENGLFSGTESGNRITVEATARKRRRPFRPLRPGGPRHFAIVGIPMLLGRDIGPRDVATEESVCVVNESFAEFYSGPRAHRQTRDRRVPGHAQDFRNRRGSARRPRRQPAPRYLSPLLPLALQPLGTYSPHSCTTRSARRATPFGGDRGGAQEHLLCSMPPSPSTASKRSTCSWTIRCARNGWRPAPSAFGGLALLLASIGLYGALSYAVARPSTRSASAWRWARSAPR